MQAIRVKYSGAKHSSAERAPPLLAVTFMQESAGYV